MQGRNHTAHICRPRNGRLYHTAWVYPRHISEKQQVFSCVCVKNVHIHFSFWVFHLLKLEELQMSETNVFSCVCLEVEVESWVVSLTGLELVIVWLPLF